MNDRSEELQSILDENRDEIAEVAYSYYESRGHEDGHDVEDWLAAEQEVRRRHTVQRAETARSATHRHAA